MNIFVKDYPDCLKESFVKFSSLEVDNEYDKAIKNLQNKVEYPGYRKGKVPVDIIENRFFEELKETVIRGLFSNTLVQLQIDGNIIYTEPRFRPLSNFKKNSPFSFSLIFEVTPKIKNEIDTSKITVEFDEYYIDDKMIDYAIEKSIKQTYKNLTEANDAIIEEDIVTVKIKKDNSENAFDSSKVKSLIGKKKGDNVSLSFNELDEYIVEYLDETDKKIDIEIVKVERPSKPEINDEFIKNSTEFKSLKDYKDYIKTKYEDTLIELNRMNKQDSLMVYIGKNADVEFPKSLYLNDIQHQISHFLDNSLNVSEISVSELINEENTKRDFEKIPERTIDNIAFYLFVKDYVEKNKIEMNETIYNELLLKKAQEEGVDFKTIKQKITREDSEKLREKAVFDNAVIEILNKINFKSAKKLPMIKIK